MPAAKLSQIVLLGMAFSGICLASGTPNPTWISLKSNHFEMYTTNTEEQALSTLEVLESVRSFFEQTTSLIQPGSKPVRIIAFRSRDEYAPFRLQATSFAHYLHSRRGDYIVLQDISPEHTRAAIHEYTHYVFRMAGLQLPIWLCEGTADFYSSFQVQGGRSMVGGVLPSRARSLEGGDILPLDTVFGVDHSSPFYSDPKKVILFYGQSWAMVHMLAFHPHYRDQFARFLQVVSSGASCPDAFRTVYQRDIAEVTSDLKSYLPQLASNQSVSDFRSIKHDQPLVAELSDMEAALTMADLLAAHRTTARLAKDRLEAIQDQHPGNPKAEELLAYLAAQEPGTRAAH